MVSERVRVGIIGIGQIGSRHLQAFAKWDRPVEVYVMDPDPYALCLARKRLEEDGPLPQTLHLIEFRTLHEFAQVRWLDLAIVATGAAVRLYVLQQLLQYCHITCMLLEKVLFQNPDHYAQASDLLRQHHVRAWVNCPYRTASYFRQLKSRIGTGKIQYCAYGSQLNMGSNTVHHLDLFSYLTGASIERIEAGMIHDRLLASKHKDCVEFTGTIEAYSSGGHRLALTSFPHGTIPLVIRIMTSDFVSFIYPLQQHYEEHTASGFVSGTFCLPLQSERTHLIAAELLETGTCALPDYEEARPSQQMFTHTLLERMADITGRRYEACPIT